MTYSTSSFIWLNKNFLKKNQNCKSYFEVPYNSQSSNETTLLFGPSANVTANEVGTTTVGATVVDLDANVTVENFTDDNETLVEEIGTEISAEIKSSAESKYPTHHITMLLTMLVAFN